jgi:hypothetical protein
MLSLHDTFHHFPTDGVKGNGLVNFLRARWRTVLLTSLIIGLLSGCGGSDALVVPSYSPQRMAQDALAEYDTNHDGYLDAKELEHCPSLKASLGSIDQDGDHRLSADELTQRIRVYTESELALKRITCRVLLDGHPLQGATVTYVPEKFMGSAIRQASGVTDKTGDATLKVEGQKLPGVQPGFYRVQVSKKSAGGQETVAARYNENTTLGTEVSPRRKRVERRGAFTDDDAGIFRLSSKSK